MIDKKNYLIALLVFVSIITKAQPQYFQKSIGPTNISGGNDIVNSIYQTWDAGYIICGSTQSYGAGFIDGFIAKYDSIGNQQWAKTYGTANYEATYRAIVTSDSGYLFAGGVFDAAITNLDILVIKTDLNGALQWSKKYGGALNNEAASTLEGIQQTADLGYIITGVTNGYDIATSNNIFMIKTDAMGDTLWTRVYTAPGFDQGVCVKQTFDGGYILSGRTNSFGAGQLDALLIKTDSLGIITWANAYGGLQGDEAMSVKQTSDSGFIATGATYSFGAGYSDLYVFKTDFNGVVQWSRAFGEAGVEASYQIIPTQNGGYAVAGFTQSYLSPAAGPGNPIPQGTDSANIVLLKMDSTGAIEWSNVYGGKLLDEAYGLSQATDGGYLIAATTRSFGSDTTDNGYIAHTDANGELFCYKSPISMQIKDSILTTTSANYTYTWGMDYSNYTLTETSIIMDDNLLCITVGIDAIKENITITIYPNPSTTNCNVIADDFTNATLYVYDLTGRMLHEEHFSSRTVLNMETLATGLYWIELRDFNGKNAQSKIVKSIR